MQLLKIVIITSDHKSTTHYRQWQAIQKFVYFFSKTFQIILMYCFLLSYFKNVLESTNMDGRYELILEHVREFDWLDYSRNVNKTSILVDNNWTEI